MRVLVALVAALGAAAVVAGCDSAARGQTVGPYADGRAALVVLDMQRDFVGPAARMPIGPGQAEPLLAAVNARIAAAQAAGEDVVYVRNAFAPGDVANWFRNRAAVAGEPGAALDPRLRLADGPIFDKDQPDAFGNPKFEAWLRQRHVDRITVAGVFADQCVAATAKAALARGYAVLVDPGLLGAANPRAVAAAAEDLYKAGARRAP